MPSGARIDGTAATLHQPAPLTPASLIEQPDVIIEGLALEGLTTDYVTSGAVYNASGIKIAAASGNVRIEKNTIVGPGPTWITATSHMHAAGIRVIAPSGWRIASNEISGYAQGILTTVGVFDFEIVRNHIRDIPGQHGIYLGAASNGTAAGNLIQRTGLLDM